MCIREWDAATGKEVAKLEGHTGPVTSVAISPDGSRIISGWGRYSVKKLPGCWNPVGATPTMKVHVSKLIFFSPPLLYIVV
jgi:WD40 repeat protein